jgi:hypothetical protein
MKKIALLCVLAVLSAFWASSSFASQKADSANRFRLVADDDGLGGVNVRISETTSTALPLDIRDRVGAIVSACIVGHVDVTKIKYYQYDTKYSKIKLFGIVFKFDFLWR